MLSKVFIVLFPSLVLLLIFGDVVQCQKISADERRIIDHVDARFEEAVSLLEKTVNIESPTENLAGVKLVGSVIMEELRSIGFRSRWIEMPPGMKSAGHLYAETGESSRSRRVVG